MVCDRTEGRPAGIQLAGLSLVSKSVRSESIQSFARLVVSETEMPFVVDEVGVAIRDAISDVASDRNRFVVDLLSP
jgi:hypothetical protein